MTDDCMNSGLAVCGRRLQASAASGTDTVHLIERAEQLLAVQRTVNFQLRGGGGARQIGGQRLKSALLQTS